MNANYEPSAELADLLVMLTEGELDEPQRARLNAIMSEDPAARDHYVSYMSTHAMLEFRHQGPPVLELPALDPEEGLIPRQRGSSSTWIGIAVAASILLAVTIGVYQLPDREADLTVGTIFGDSLIVMEDGELVNRFEVGVASAPAGGVRGRLRSGVALAIEGNADFEVLPDVGQFRLLRGKMRVHVPPKAIGFTVLAGEHQVVDLGTEFGVSVNKHDEVEVHVFDGAVELAGAHELKAGQAVFLDHKGRLGKARLEAKQFPKLEP